MTFASASHDYNFSETSYPEILINEKNQIKNKENKSNNNKFRDVAKLFNPMNIFNYKKVSFKTVSYGNDDTINEEDYKIAMSQNGKFAVAFDSANLRIKILENTDHRPFIYNKKKIHSVDNKNTYDDSDQINKIVGYFKIQNDFTIDQFYNDDFMPDPFIKDDHHNSFSTNETITMEKFHPGTSTNGCVTMENKVNLKDNRFRWSYDISNAYNKNGRKFIFVAVSRVKVDEDMMGEKYGDNESLKITKIESDCKTTIIQIKKKKSLTEKITAIDMRSEHPELKEKQKLQETKGIGIYCIELKKKKNGKGHVLKRVTCDYYSCISGICRFIEVPNKRSFVKRFLVLNFYGMYNFEFDGYFRFTEKFNYPKSIRRELNYWYTKKNCMNRLLSCIYDRYFLVKQHKDNVELYEVYDLVEMKLTTTTKSFGDDNNIRSYRSIFSFSKLQFCYTQGNNTVKLHYLESGLQVASKTFKELEQICSLEFIDSDEKLLLIGKDTKEEMKFLIWDIYNTGKVELITLPNIGNLDTHLARTSGNILQIDDEGNVRSVLKRIENELLKQKINKEKAENKLEKIMKSNMENFIATRLDGSPDKNHVIWFDKNINPTFEPIIIEKEPWVLGDYGRASYCLYQNKIETEIETLQLMVGRSTVQIWHQIQDDSKNEDDLPNKGEPFLEYIWATGIPVNQEREATGLQVEKFEHEGINDISNDFYLKVYWYEKNLSEYVEEEEIEEDEEITRVEQDQGFTVVRREKVISRKDIVDKINAIRHACKALDHLNKRKKFLFNSYSKMRKFEKIVEYIEHIVWKFIKYNPDQFKLLDVRRNIMKILILGNCNQLIKYILFGENKEHEHVNKEHGHIKHGKEEGRKMLEIRHVPRNKLWPGKKYMKEKELDVIDINMVDNDKMIPENDLELAIYHFRGCELKNTIVVAYFLEYYSSLATDNIGWMCTVSKALPLLFKYNYDDYAKKLFRKECFADQDHFSTKDSFEIIPKKYLARRNHDIKFRAFKPIFNLRSDKYRWYDGIFNYNDNEISFKSKVYKFFEDLDNDLGKSPIALRVVPLPRFTINNISKDKVDYNIFKIILNLIWFIFIPRWYKIKRNEKDKLSPFSRVIHYENNDDIFDNPATEAVIDFHWKKARNFFLFLFIRFLIFGVCFVLVSWAYCVHEDLNLGSRNLLIALIIIFYYLATYLLATELIQLCYHGPREYFSNVFSSFDLISVILPVIVMTLLLKNFQISNGFESVEVTDVGLLTGIAFSIFFLWIEMILFLRLTSNMALYINYFIYIIKTVYPFIVFMLIIIVAFAHTMFILLRDPLNINNIKINSNSFSGSATNYSTNEILDVNIQSDFDPDDNPFSQFLSSIEATYFWLSSNWVQRDQFDFWPSEVITVIASLFLVIILQNMLIAFMGGVYEKAETNGRQSLLRSRANHIADYEALHHIHFWNVDPEPEYLYYIGQSKNFEEWYEMRKEDQKPIYEGFEQKSTFMRRVFKIEDYDKVSIWNYDHIEIMNEIEEIEIMKYEMNFIVEKLLGKLQKS